MPEFNVHYSDENLPTNIRKNSIFLAGPTPRSTEVSSWRPEALAILEKLGFTGDVFVPERRDWTRKFDYTDQVEWENSAMEKCGVILFWLPRVMATMPGLTTNVEFGRFISQKKNAVYGRPDRAENIRYLDWMYKKGHPSAVIHDALENALAEAVKKVKPKVWLTADWHLGETRLEIMQRPFSSTDEMDHALLTNHNALVDPDDTVIVAGDAISKTSENWSYSLRKVSLFNGRKTLIRGNHDDVISDDVLQYFFDKIIPYGGGIELEHQGIPLYVTHYPTLARADRFNLVGHIHAAWKLQLNALNVGVDVHHFRPVCLDRVPFYLKAASEFYDDDVWAAYHPSNAAFRGKRGKAGSYYPPKATA